jgi:hypothetical protein
LETVRGFFNASNLPGPLEREKKDQITVTLILRFGPVKSPKKDFSFPSRCFPRRLACPKLAIEISRRDRELNWEKLFPKAVSDKVLRPRPQSCSSGRRVAESGLVLT